MDTTLVLNADAQPVSIVPLSTVHWQDAVRIIFLNRASVMEEYDHWVVRSPSVQMRMPSVIMLKDYQQHNGKVEFSRFNVILRDNYTCQYCGNVFPFDKLTFDHVIPRRENGTTTWNNIVSACYSCNQEKAHHSKMKPKNSPRRPTYWELAENRRTRPIVIPDKSWELYLGWKGEVIVNADVPLQNSAISIDEDLPFI